MTSMNPVRVFSFGVVALVFTAATASANLTPVFGSDPLITAGNLSTLQALDSSVTAAMEGDYLYEYTFQLDSAQQILGGQSALCLDELTGLIGSSAATTAASWTATQGATGGCLAASTPLNAGSAPGNTEDVGAWVEVNYSGALVSGPLTPVGSLYFVSSDGNVGNNNDAFGGKAQANQNTAQQGTTTTNQGEMDGPVSTLPEPTTLFLVGLGLSGIGLVRFRPAKKK
jgi:hypothetical protein